MTAEQLKRYDAYPILVQLVRSLTEYGDAKNKIGHAIPSAGTVNTARLVLKSLGELPGDKCL